MKTVAVSICASSIRPELYDDFFKSLNGTTVPYEVIFVGPNPPEKRYINFRYIETRHIKPAQCYQIAFMDALGETIHWTADDAEYSPDCIGKAYNYWKKKSQNDDKLILSMATKENGNVVDMDDHRLFGYQRNTPLMAPLALISRRFFMDELNGIDRRYVCGQYENDVVMRAYQAGGRVEIWKDGLITLEHYHKHGLERSFATGYEKDREILEGSWVNKDEGRTISDKQLDVFEPFENKDLLIKSQSNKGNWV